MQSFKHIVIVSDLMTFGYFDKSTSTVFSTHCHLFIHDFYANSIITLQNLGHSDLILFIYLKKKKWINWKIRWIIIRLTEIKTDFFHLGRQAGIFKGNCFFPLGRQTDFVPFLEDKLEFSKGTYFPWISFLGRQSEFLKGYTFEFFPLEDKLDFSEGN